MQSDFNTWGLQCIAQVLGYKIGRHVKDCSMSRGIPQSPRYSQIIFCIFTVFELKCSLRGMQILLRSITPKKSSPHCLPTKTEPGGLELVP